METFIKELEQLGLSLKEKNGDLLLSGSNGKLRPEELLHIKQNPYISTFIKDNKAQLVQYFSAKKQENGTSKLRLNDIAAMYALSPLQEGMLFHSLYDNKTTTYITQFSIDFPEGLDVAAFEQSWKFVVRNHTILRTAFIHDKVSIPLQCVYKDVTLPFAVLDYSHLSKQEQENQYSALLLEDQHKGFDFDKPPLTRVTLVKMDEIAMRMIWTKHHILWDGWSGQVIISEVLSAYKAYVNGEQPAERPVDQYEDYIKFISSIDPYKEKQFWKEYLAGFEEPALLPFTANTGDRNKGVGTFREQTLALGETWTSRIEQYVQSAHITVSTFIQGIWAILLSKYSGKDDIVFGVTVSGRPAETKYDNKVGLYINTLPFRARFIPDLRISDWLMDSQRMHVKAREYQYASLTNIRKWNKLSGDIFDSILVFRNYPLMGGGGSRERTLAIGNVHVEENNNYLLSIEVNLNSRITVDFKYNTALLATADVEMIKGHFEHALKQVTETPDARLSDINILTPAEEQYLLVDLNATAKAYPQGKTFVQLFEAQAQQTPDRPALTFGGKSLTYKELNESANRLARYLEKKGAGPGTLVGICLDRSHDMLICLLSILKTGAAYIPIDPEYPADRISYMLSDSAAPLVMSTSSLQALLGIEERRLVLLDTLQSAIAAEAADDLIALAAPEDLAYVIYTSGSTGRPKGVMIEHKALVNFLCAMTAQLRFSADNSLLAVTTFCFDISYLELYMPLLTGGQVIMASREVAMDGFLLQEMLDNERPTHMQATPATWQLLLDSGWRNKEEIVILSGGEAIKDALKESLVALGGREVWNMFGPTETTIWSTMKQLYSGEAVMIGRPIHNTQVYIVDKYMQLVPAGVKGELCISGDGVARGYLNRHELTAEKFISNSFGQGRLYRTGDLAKWREDGHLVYLDRMDNQVKIRGYRIELGEIENVLQQSAMVGRNAVVAKEDSTGAKRLIAYVVPVDNYDKKQLQAYLSTRLPAYMIPSLWIEVDEMPLTANGKINRSALPVPDVVKLNAADYVAPRNETEVIMVNLWQDLLHIGQIGIYDNFFELGGHSLLAMRVIAALRKHLQVEVSLKELFTNPTVASLSAIIEGKNKSMLLLQGISPAARGTRIPLSYSQERLWFIDQLGGSVNYHIPYVRKFGRSINIAHLRAALHAIVNRHEALRTVIREEGGIAYQEILPQNSWVFHHEKLQDNGDEAFQLQLQEAINTPFDLAKDHPFRAVLFERNVTNDYVLVLVLHHISADDWSANILGQELTELYNAASAGRLPLLKPLEIQYADYAIWQREQVLGDKLAYWEKKLAQLPNLDIPLDFARPAIQSTRGGAVKFDLDEQLVKELHELCRQEGVTLFMLLLSAFKLLLYKYTGQPDLCVGSPVANRQMKELEPLIGYFLNALALRTEVNSGESFSKLLSDVKETVLEAYQHQEVPFEKIVQRVVKERNVTNTPLFQVWFDLHSTAGIQHARKEQPGGVTLLDFDVDVLSQDRKSKFDLEWIVKEDEYGIHFRLGYCSDLFRASTIERMKGHYCQLLSAIVRNPHQPMATLQMLTSKESHQLLADFNATTVADDRDTDIISRFEAQVANHPDHIALVCGRERLTYQELYDKVAQLAYHLQVNYSLQPDDLVGVMMDRSIWAIISILGILKAGGAYVPIEIDYPIERKSFIIKDTGLKLLIIESASMFDVLELEVPVLSIDIQLETFEQTTAVTKTIAGLHDLVYVIYTSGSTGNPKGVMIEHNSLLNYLNYSLESYHIEGTPFNFPLFTALSFDLTQTSIFLTLLTGGTLYIENSREPGEVLPRIFQHTALNSIKLTPSHIRLLEGQRFSSTIQCAIVGGEALHAYHIRILKQLNPYMVIYNEYGPTETTIGSSVQEISDADTPVTIGSPLWNTAMYILDADKNLVPVGSSGELYIGGAGLARGYLKRPALTAEKFIGNPFGGGRLYKTGDLGKWQSDGSILYLGRVDDQVKIRGHRIELGEIIAVLNSCSKVEQATVLARADADGNRKLVAYIVPVGAYDKEAIREYLKNILPDYMVPALMVEMTALPLTHNGKIDQKALPDPEVASLATQPYVAPRNEIEYRLAEIWQGLLKVSPVGIHDNFFELGGDSIISIQVVSRCNSQGMSLHPQDIFDRQTIALLAERVNEQAAGIAAEQGMLSGEADLLPIQQWFFETVQTHPSHFNQSRLLSIDKSVKGDQIAAVMHVLLAYHDALRAGYRKEGEKWLQYFGDMQECFEEVTLEPSAEDITTICNRWQQRLDIHTGKVIRVVLIKSPDNESHNRLLIAIHHLSVDGVSWRILLNHFQSALQQVMNGEAITFGSKSSSVREWVEALKTLVTTHAITSQLPYWKSIAAAYQPLPASPETAVFADRKTYSVSLDGELTRYLLQDVNRAYHTEINDILLSALAQAFLSWSGQSQVVIGMEGHGREFISRELDLSNTVGWFTSMYPVQLLADKSLSIGEHISSVKERLRQVPQKGLGYGLLRYLHPDNEVRESLSGQHWDLVFNYLGQSDNVIDKEELIQGAAESAGENISAAYMLRNKIEVNSIIKGGVLVLYWNYAASQFEEANIAALASAYINQLQELIRHCIGVDQRVYTPSDYGLASAVSVQELNNFLKTAGQEHLSDIYPLSPLQKGMLFHYLYNRKGRSFMEQLRLDFPEGLDIPAFKASWQHIINKHSILRTGFVADVLSIPVQCVYDKVTLPVTEIDYSHLPSAEQETSVAAFLEEDLQREFDLERPPLMRITLIKLGASVYKMVWTHYHIILDGWSNAVLIRELLEAYTGFVNGKGVVGIEEDRYADYIRYISAGDEHEATVFWKNYLSGYHEKTFLPFAENLPDRNKRDGKVNYSRMAIDEQKTAQIRQYCQQQQITVNTLVQGVWSLLLHWYTGLSDVAFGVVVSGRPSDLKDAENRVGLYINSLPLRTVIPKAQSVGEWLRELQQGHTTARKYQYTSLNDIQHWTELKGDLFDSILIFENYPKSTQAPEGLPLKTGRKELNEQTNYLLTIMVNLYDKLVFNFSYNSELLQGHWVEMIKDHFRHTLENIIREGSSPVADISIVTKEERQRLLASHEENKFACPTDKNVIALFETQAGQTPGSIALVFEGQAFTYQEINERANRLAAYLQQIYQMKAGDLVGIRLDQGEKLVMAILGVLKTGAVYVPMDEETPLERVNYIMDDARCRHLLDAGNIEAALAYEGVYTPAGPVEDMLAVIYTSGSTGTPKGTCISHSNLLNRLYWMWQEYPFEAHEVSSMKTSVSFVDHLWELFGPLLKGISLVIFRKRAVLDIDGFISSLYEHKVSRIVLVPSLLKEMLLNKKAYLLKDLKYWTCSGEELPDTLINNFFNLFGENTLLNIYGSTEVTADATCYALSKGDQSPKGCIGKPIYNTAVYILSDSLALLPPGITGELCVSGAGVSAGYLHRPDLTGERFIDHPFEKGEKLYLTGDLARWLPDGNIAYMGRKDSQVKIRGNRVELKEIEQALLRKKELVNQAVVTTKEVGGEKVIVAYVVAADILDKVALKAFLETALPVYMLPAYIVELEQIPLTYSGKVNKRALPEVEDKDLVRKMYKAPQNSIERLLADIWQDVLGVARIGISDNFYELGGNSLRSVHIVARLKQAHFHVDVVRILKYPTIETLAPFVTHLDGVAEVNIGNEAFELTGNQLAYFRDNEYRHAVGTFSLELHPFNQQQWLQVMEQACKEMEILRMKIYVVDGKLKQSPLPISAIAPDVTFLEVDDLHDVKTIKKVQERPLDLGQGKGIRSCVCYKGEKAIAYVMIHHALTDDASNRLLRNWLHGRYHNSNRIVIDPVEHRRFAALQRFFLQSNAAQEQLQYWRSTLTPLLGEQSIYPEPAHTVDFECRILHDDYLDTLQFCRKNNITPGSFILSLALLDQYFLQGGRKEFIVNTIVNIRENEQGIGQFSNVLPLGITIDSNASLSDVFRQIHQVHLDGRAHGQVPYDSIEKALGTDLQQYVFAAYNYRDLPGIPMPSPNEAQKENGKQEYPFDIRCDNYGDGMVIKISMNNRAYYRNGSSVNMLTALLRTTLKQPMLPLSVYYSPQDTALNEQAQGSDH